LRNRNKAELKQKQGDKGDRQAGDRTNHGIERSTLHNP